MLAENIEKDFISAFKAKDELKTSVLRMLKSAIKNKEIELGKKLEDSDVLKILASQVKQRRDAVAEYEKGGRPELAEKEKAEEIILAVYLPAQLLEPEIREKIQAVIAEVGATSSADFGKVMSRAMVLFGGAADGNLASQILKDELAKL